MRNCKLKIAKCELQSCCGEGGVPIRQPRFGRSKLHFSLFTFQCSLLFFFTLPFLLLSASQAFAQQKNSCIECHAKLDDPRISAPAKLFDNDIHKARGLMCNDCHGGDPTAY